MNIEGTLDSFDYGGVIGFIKIGDETKNFTCELKESFDIEDLVDTFNNFGVALRIGFRDND